MTRSSEPLDHRSRIFAWDVLFAYLADLVYAHALAEDAPATPQEHAQTHAEDPDETVGWCVEPCTGFLTCQARCDHAEAEEQRDEPR